MKTYKFRVWDKNAKEMISWDWFKKDDITRILLSFCLIHDVKHVMQYTGLKDSRGKDIYEGDIIEVNINGFNGKFEMKFIANGFWLDYGDGCFELPNKEYRKIIGNKYENAELLN